MRALPQKKKPRAKKGKGRKNINSKRKRKLKYNTNNNNDKSVITTHTNKFNQHCNIQSASEHTEEKEARGKKEEKKGERNDEA